ncbi:MAG TPA: MurT ligase domain-containing protein [Dehalococcoidia bacterium]|nr:MurT ligase domain-containing protein [Dehalococcoidia bacterium]
MRTTAAVIAGKAAGAASRLLRLGGGTAIAGLVAGWVDPDIVRNLGSSLPDGAVLISATNGKTTTAALLAALARESGLEPVANASGSNMMRGIAAALLAAGPPGRSAGAGPRIGVFEVDEATLPYAVQALNPRAIVLGNLFRDQLDRYGEVDHVAGVWRRTLEGVEPRTTVALNSDDPLVASLAPAARGRVIFFGVDDRSAATGEPQHAADVRSCPRCGAPLAYDAVFYGHVGHWRCPEAACGAARPLPDVRAEEVRLSAEGAAVRMATPHGDMTVEVPLAGLYNVYNLLAAASAALAVGIPLDALPRATRRFSAAFGRQERFDIEGRRVVMLLAKNPTGLNQTLRTILGVSRPLRALLFLNDGEADGRDVSWIWDADFELLAGRDVALLMASGRRAEDLALRLKYAGLGDDVPVIKRARAALDAAIRATPPGETLFVLPTYTAMLEAREVLAARAGRRPFWEAPS